MRSSLFVASIISVLGHGAAYSFTGSSVQHAVLKNQRSNLSMEYIPSGMSKKQWEELKKKEAARKGKNLGKQGITTFQSRTFAEWQKAGGKNLFPVDPKSVKDPKDIPYMQRPGGKPDDSDLKKGGGGGSFGGIFGKKKAPPKPEPKVEEKKTNWWTL